MHKPKLIQLIHVAKNQLNLSDDIYRLILKHHTGKTSCKTCTIAELNNVLRHLKGLGFEVKPNRQKQNDRSAICYKIKWLWQEMAKEGIVRDKSDTALNAFVRSVINKKNRKDNENLRVLNLNALNDRQATIVLERLKKWYGRT